MVARTWGHTSDIGSQTATQIAHQTTYGWLVTACPPRPHGAEQTGLLKRPICTTWKHQLPFIFKIYIFHFHFHFHHFPRFSNNPCFCFGWKKGAAAEKKQKKGWSPRSPVEKWGKR